MILRATAVWLVIMVFAILNGALREYALAPWLGERGGHAASTLVLCAVIVAVAWLGLGWIGPGSRHDAVMVGGLWLALTLAFEFLAGHYLFGAPWSVLLDDYNVLEGRIWPLVPLTVLLAPILLFGTHSPPA